MGYFYPIPHELNNRITQMELSINKLKYIVSLQQKKNREEEGVFIAEGLKVINDLVKFGFIPQLMAYNPEIWNLEDFGQSHAFCEYYTTTNVQDKKISLLSTAPGVLAVFPQPSFGLDKNILKTGYAFLLDNINDPGNLGTIIRTAHWYGVTDLFITKGSVEVFGPKVVQSSMGSLAAVKVHVVDSESFINELKTLQVPIYITDMKGEDVKSAKVKQPACIVFGNEANGISEVWRKHAHAALTIAPVQPSNQPESLNLSVSAAIFMELLTRL
jgi:TrmH family RNA methyltransferase